MGYAGSAVYTFPPVAPDDNKNHRGLCGEYQITAEIKTPDGFELTGERIAELGAPASPGSD